MRNQISQVQKFQEAFSQPINQKPTLVSKELSED